MRQVHRPDIQPYAGEGEYIFVSYSHEDEALVYDSLSELQSEGFNVWFDEGIGPGHNWRNDLAQRIEGCAVVLFFLTQHSLVSTVCRREIDFALENDKVIITVHLTEAEMSSDWRFILGDRQGIFKYRLEDKAYFTRLRTALGEFLSFEAPPQEQSETSSPQHHSIGLLIELPRKSRKSLAWVAVVIALLIPLLMLLVDYNRRHEASRWTREVAMPELESLLQEDKIGLAYHVAERIEAEGDAELLTSDLWQEISVEVDIATDPEGAAAYYRLYDAPADEWIAIGETPIKNGRLPRDLLVLKLEKEGYEPAIRVSHSPGIFTRNAAYNLEMSGLLDKYHIRFPTIPMTRSSESDGQMIGIPESDFPLQFLGFSLLEPVHIPAYEVGRFEVTNEEYQAFVDAGGYDNESYWQDFGANENWIARVATFKDKTGKPGPATWEFGRFPDGTSRFPVNGLSWYEAKAYARYRGMALPTISHWVRAAVMLMECCEPVAPSLIKQSNFSGSVKEVDDVAGLSPFGHRGMAGNVREWAHNRAGEFGTLMGASHEDAPYFFHQIDYRLLDDRSATNGLRLASYGNSSVDEFMAEVERTSNQGNLAEREPVSDAEFADLPALLAYPKVPVTGEVLAEHRSELRVRQEVQVTTRNGITISLHLWIPAHQKPPFDAVLYMGGAGGFGAKGKIDDEANWVEDEIFDMILRSGRAVVWPIFTGSFERYDNIHQFEPESEAASLLWRERLRNWVRETGWTLDYLDGREDFSGVYGYLGVSFGGIVNWNSVFYEDRIRAAMHFSGGVPRNWGSDSNLDPVHFLPRIKTPFLLLNGGFDYIVARDSVERAYELLGTPEEHKRMVIYDAGHWPLPRNQMRREVLSFLDKYLK